MFSHFLNPPVLIASLISPSKLCKVAFPLMSLKLSCASEFLSFSHWYMYTYYCLHVIKWNVNLRWESDRCSISFSNTQIWTLHYDISWSRYKKVEPTPLTTPNYSVCRGGNKKVTMVHFCKTEAPALFYACPNLPKRYLPKSLSLIYVQLPFCTVCSVSIYCMQ